MGKVIRKTFLGLGKSVEEYYCDKCGKQLPLGCRFYDQNSYDEDYKNVKIYCGSCGNSIDYEIVHSMGNIKGIEEFELENFFKDTQDGKEKYIEQCNRCQGLTVYRKLSHKVTFEGYYQVGFKEPQHKLFKCHDIAKEVGYKNGELKSQTECHHSWVTIATSKKMDAEAHEKYKRIRKTRNYTVERMYGVDTIDYQYSCFGATHYWCFKCGLYRRLNPQRENLLPKYGRN